MEKPNYVCYICKRQFKRQHAYNKHAKKFDLRHKIIQGKIYTWLPLELKITHILEDK